MIDTALYLSATATAPTPEGWYLTTDMTCIWFPGQLLREESGAPWDVWPFGPVLTDHSSDAWKPLNRRRVKALAAGHEAH